MGHFDFCILKANLDAHRFALWKKKEILPLFPNWPKGRNNLPTKRKESKRHGARLWTPSTTPTGTFGTTSNKCKHGFDTHRADAHQAYTVPQTGSGPTAQLVTCWRNSGRRSWLQSWLRTKSTLNSFSSDFPKGKPGVFSTRTLPRKSAGRKGCCSRSLQCSPQLMLSIRFILFLFSRLAFSRL